MYFWMTHQLIKICDNILVVQEGGYNTDYLGMHAAGVIKALILGKNEEGRDLMDVFGQATPADEAAGLLSLQDIDSTKACPWAINNVEETINHLKPFWKCLQD